MNKYVKVVIRTTHPAKKRKMPYWKEQSMVRKVWPMAKVNRKLIATFTLRPVDRMAKGQISVGISHAHGPETPHEETRKTHESTSNTLA